MPSTTEKQRRFMGAELARKRSGKKTQTGMSETQLGEFASSVSKHGSLEDITYMEDAATCDVVDDTFVHPSHKGSGAGLSYKGENTGLESGGAIAWGALDPPKVDGDSGQFTRGQQSCNRDAGQGIHYGAEVDYFGPDTDYRAEELDPHQYGKDWEPFPFKDVYKTGDKQWERGFRVSAQDEYDETQTPGAVTDSQPQTQAYGAVEWRGAGPDREIEDYRSFDSQRNFARANKDKKEPYAVDITDLDTKHGEDIR